MLRNEEKSVSLPENLEVKDQKYDGDVTFAASSNCHVRGIKAKGNVYVFSGVEPKDISSVNETLDIAEKFIKKAVFPMFGSSVKMMLQLGRTTFIETCTPDKDGISRDDEYNIKAESIINVKIKSELDLIVDLGRVVVNPTENLKVLSLRKMR